MTQLYLLTGIKEIDDLRVQIEAMLNEVGRLRSRMVKVQQDLHNTQDHLKILREALTNLQGTKCRIVSLGEYAKLSDEIDRAKRLEKSAQSSLTLDEQMTNRLIDEVIALEAKIDMLHKTYGTVLEFKKRE